MTASEDLTRLKRHVTMVMDPCNAELGPTAYRGADGIVTRFRNVVQITPAVGKQGFFYVFYPAYNSAQLVSVNPSDAVTWGANTVGPGQTFLLNNGESQRVVGACSALNYTGTELDRSGIIYSGVVPISALNVSKTVSDIIPILQHEHRVSENTIEVKFSPTASEEDYWNSGSAAPDQIGDHNAICIIGLGLSATTSAQNFSIINTLIAEWRPEPGFGLSTPNPSSHDVPAGLERVRNVLQKMGTWWYSAAKTTYNAVNSPAGKAIQSAIAMLL